MSQTRVKSIQSKHKTDYILTKLKYYTKYEITVRAFNQIGAGPTSSPQFVNTLEGGWYSFLINLINNFWFKKIKNMDHSVHPSNVVQISQS